MFIFCLTTTNTIAVGQVYTVIGQTNLFLNERFKQFAGLIDDCEMKRGEKEIKIEDLAGFWDMIYYQVEDLRVKYDQLAKLEANGWRQIEEPEVVDVVDTKKSAPVSKKKVPNGTTARITTATKTQPPSSNFRQFLKNKRKGGVFGAGGEALNGLNGADKDVVLPMPTNGKTNGTSVNASSALQHLNGNVATSKVTNNGVCSPNGTTNGVVIEQTSDDAIISQKLKNLMTSNAAMIVSNHNAPSNVTGSNKVDNLTTVVSVGDETNKEN